MLQMLRPWNIPRLPVAKVATTEGTLHPIIDTTIEESCCSEIRRLGIGFKWPIMESAETLLFKSV